MESDKFFFSPVFKNKGPRPQVENLSLSVQDFKEKFLPSHGDKIAVILLTHPQIENVESLKGMLEQWAKTCAHLRFYMMDAMATEAHTSLAEDYFQVSDLPCIALIMPSSHNTPEIMDTESVSDLNKKINSLEQDMEKKFEQMKDLVFTEVEKRINSKKVYAFIKGTPAQPRCKFTRRLLESFEGLKLESLGFSTTDILSEQVFRQWVPFYSQWPTFPQVYVDGKFAGGVDVVTEMIENEEFQELLH